MKIVAVEQDGEPQRAEYGARVVYSLLRSVMQVAAKTRLPLKKLHELVTMSYFHHLRSRGATLRDIAEIFDQTERSVGNMSQRAKTNFFSPELQHALPRRIEYHLWRGPLEVATIRKKLPDYDAVEIDHALQTLLEQGRATFDEDAQVYATTSKRSALLSSDLSARVDALSNLSDAVGDLVESRFLEDDPRGMGRCLTFRAKPQAITALRETLYAHLRDHVTLMDECADPDDDSYYVFFGVTPIVEPEEGAP